MWLKGASCISFMLTVLSAFVNITENKIPITLVLIIMFYIIDEIKDLRKKDNIAHDSHIIRRNLWCSIWLYMHKSVFN